MEDVIIGAEGACAYLGLTRDQETLGIKDENLLRIHIKGLSLVILVGILLILSESKIINPLLLLRVRHLESINFLIILFKK